METRQLVREDISQQGQKLGVENLVEHEKLRAELKAYVENGEIKKMRAAFMRSLAFPEMQDRYHTIAEAHQQTFKWIFEESEKYALPWSNFVDWLQHGTGVYWVNGKAASGKSTLMRYVVEHKLTLEHLRIWSESEEMVIGTFFFWSSGSEEQRSYTGLLRSLLYAILLERPELLFLVFFSMWESQWDESLSEIQFENHKWSLSELKRAFALVTDYSIVPLKFCFFIDGLDEYSGDHEEMAEFLKQVALSAHVKFCLSSRPWIVFEDTFQSSQMLRLQDLTYGDIKAYVADKLEGHPRMRDLSREEPVHSSELIEAIVSKASGVFLWVVIVVRNLLNGLRNRDDISDLRKRLLILPAELETLYTHMLGQVDQFYQERASRTFQIFRVLSGMRSEGLMSSLFIDIAITSTPETTISAVVEPISSEEIQKRHDHLDWHLKSHCAGLIEVPDVPVNFRCARPYHGYVREAPGRVSYLHRTVQDFVESGPVQTWLARHTDGTEFEPNISILMSLIVKIKEVLSCQVFPEQLLHMVLGNLQLVMLLAKAAEDGGRLKKSMEYIELLDEADRMGTLCTQKSWTNASWTDIYKNRGQHGGGFLAEAVSYGLRTYVSTKLEEDNTPLLQSKLNSLLLTHAVIQPNGNGCKLESRVSLDMIRLLIRLGAKPNQVWKGQTAWQRILTYVHGYCFGGDPSQMSSYLHDWIEIFRILLLSGSSSSTTCATNHRTSNGIFSTSHTVLDVIDDVFGINMPKQTLELKQLLEDRRQSDSHRNRPNTSLGSPVTHTLSTKRKKPLGRQESEPRKRWRDR